MPVYTMMIFSRQKPPPLTQERACTSMSKALYQELRQNDEGSDDDTQHHHAPHPDQLSMQQLHQLWHEVGHVVLKLAVRKPPPKERTRGAQNRAGEEGSRGGGVKLLPSYFKTYAT